MHKDSSVVPTRTGHIRALPGGVWALGFVSLFMDTSSELVHSLLPVFMATVLGASMVTIGVIEGIAEATASITKLFSGALSDYLGRRKVLVVLGYGLAAVTKPVFPLAGSIGWVAAARFVDRVGKGIRGAPRDALIADLTAPQLRGAAYGLRQSLDSIGAFLGPLLASVFLVLLANEVQTVLWIAVIPAVMAVALLVIAVREPAPADEKRVLRMPLASGDVRSLPLRYWLVVLLGAVFTLARFSEAFLILRAQDLGVTLAYVPIVLVVMNVVYAAVAYPAGVAADAISRRSLLLAGLVVLIAADLLLAFASAPSAVFAGAALWGLHMGLTQGLLSALVADTAPHALRGTAFGIFNLISGIALFGASLIAGALWSLYGAFATFIAGAVFSGAAAVGLLAYRFKQSRPGTVA